MLISFVFDNPAVISQDHDMENVRDLDNYFEKTPIMFAAAKALDEKSLRDIIDDAGYLLFIIDGAKVRSTKDLFDHLSTTLKFPEYFGHNWSAIFDCLTDLDWWLPSKGYIILCKNSDTLMDNPTLDLKIFVKVIKDASEFWRAQGVQFGLIFEVEEKNNYHVEDFI